MTDYEILSLVLQITLVVVTVAGIILKSKK